MDGDFLTRSYTGFIRGVLGDCECDLVIPCHIVLIPNIILCLWGGNPVFFYAHMSRAPVARLLAWEKRKRDDGS